MVRSGFSIGPRPTVTAPSRSARRDFDWPEFEQIGELRFARRRGAERGAQRRCDRVLRDRFIGPGVTEMPRTPAADGEHDFLKPGAVLGQLVSDALRRAWTSSRRCTSPLSSSSLRRAVKILVGFRADHVEFHRSVLAQ